MSVRFLSLDGARTVDDTDSAPSSKLLAMLYEMRRLLGRYGADAFLTAAQQAAAIYDADDNNPSPLDSAHLRSPYGGPTFTSITPDHAAHDSGQAVTIAGTNFAPGTTVTIGGEPVTSFVRVSATSLTCHVPNDLAAGTYDIVITTPSGLAVTAADGWTSDS